MSERLVCLACGTVTRDQRCDCNRYGAGHAMYREPRFVNFADQLLENLREEREAVDRALARLAKAYGIIEDLLGMELGSSERAFEFLQRRS